MGTQDKISNETQDVKGRIKEAAGSISGDRELADKGKTDQAKASVKQTGEDLKDAGRELRDSMR